MSIGGGIVNAKEVAKLLDIHPNTIYNLIREGKIKAEKKGRSFDIPQSEVDTLRHSKGKENLAQAQERAAYQLIVNINSEIEADLSMIQFHSRHLERHLEVHGIKEGDHSNETYEKRRKLYEENETSPLKSIVDISKNIARLENLKVELEKIANDAEKDNSFDKSLDNWKEFIQEPDWIGKDNKKEGE